MHNQLFPCALVGAALALSANAAGAPLTIAELAPPDAAAIVSIDDWSRMRVAFDRAGFRALLDEPAVEKWVDKLLEEPLKELEDALEAIDAEPGDIGFPAGPAGFAMWFGMDAERKAFRGRWLATADYGDRAEAVMTILVDILNEGVDDGNIELDEVDYGDATIHTVTFVVEPEVEDEDDEDDWEDWEEKGPFENLLGEKLFAGDHYHIARVGAAIVAAGDMEAIERAVDALSGERGRAVAGEHQYTAARAQLEGAHCAAILFIRPFLDRAARLRESDEWGGMLGDLPLEIFDALGLDEVQAVSLGLRFDSDRAMAELQGGILAPQKDGLLSLFDMPGEAFAAPAFAGADASTLTSFRFNFRAVPALVQRVIMTMPEAQRAQIQAGAGLVMTAAAPLFATLGPDVVSVSTVDRPFSPTSERSFYAIRCADPVVVSDLLTQFGAMAQLTPSDFEGNQIWRAQPGGMAPMPAIGVGFGHVFIGQQEAVEEAMRMAGRAEAPRLAREEHFRRAAATVAPGACYYSFAELRPLLEYVVWTFHNQGPIARQAAEAWIDQLEPEEREEFLRELEENTATPEWTMDMPPVDVFLRHLGDFVGEIRPSPDGFRWKTLWLAPGE